MKYTSFLKFIILGMALVSFPACDGIFENIYDKPEEQKEYGFIEVDERNNSGTIYVNASKYTDWVYIDFHTREIDSLEISDNMTDPANWDIAIHRYDLKTNGATVLETEFTELSALKNSGKVPDGKYVADIMTEEKIAIDVSDMFNGNMVYARSYYNAELSKWLFVDTSGMPPSFYPSNKVYVIKLKDNTVAAVRFRNFRNTDNVTGYITIEYIYPYKP